MMWRARKRRSPGLKTGLKNYVLLSPESINLDDANALRVVTQAQLTLPLKPRPRKMCVRVVDVFGFEAEVVSMVAAA